MISSRLLSVAFVLLVQTLTLRPASANICHICGDAGNDLMHYPHIILSNVGKTCNDISVEVAVNHAYGSAGCGQQQNQWRGRCCNPNQQPSGTDQRLGGLPPQNIPNVPHTGPNPICNVCRDGDYPYDTSMVLNFLYMGVGTCVQYYILGQRGAIEPHMCAPVQFFSYEPCACGEFNPYYNQNHPLNNQAQQAPGQQGGGNVGGGNVDVGRTNGSSNGSSNGGGNSNGIAQQKVPDSNADKSGQKMGSQYGGAGGVHHGGRRRGLKGSKAPPARDVAPAPVEDVVVQIDV